ncbi:MAG TPA: hypothetical protein VD813_04060 [Pseudonocardia sp.]|nr:hypothetical protein [Pseudonocardia sp.]
MSPTGTSPGPHRPGAMTPEERAAYRAFVREHHPDRGGDPEAFVAGLARFRQAGDDSPGAAHGPAAGQGTPAAEAGPPPQRPGPPQERPGPMPLPLRVAVALVRTWRRRHEQ